MASNDKASVTKELHEKHRKILEGLLKLPENRECADCKSRGPRWASVNLGIFVCIQCSGIHRSLGVHISKVRSATLDTWLPEQVAFIQSMGNAKANSYWEAELPPNYDRVGLENFIRAKYEEKRWVPRNSRSPPRLVDEKHLSVDKQWTVNGGKDHRGYDHNWKKKPIQETSERGGHHLGDDVGPSHTDKEGVQNQGQKHESSPSQDPKVSHHEASKGTAIPTIAPPKNLSPAVQSPSVTSSHKVEVATDLFDLLTIQEPAQSVDESPSQVDDDNSWAAFQSAEALDSTKNSDATNSSTAKNDVIAGLEDLFKPSQSINDSPAQPQSEPHPRPKSQPQSQHQLPTDAKKDIMSLFEKSTMSSPYALQQQQMAAYLVQQQSMLMAAAASPGNQASLFQTQHQQLLNNNSTVPVNSLGVTAGQTWKNANSQFPGVMIPGIANSLGTQNGLQPSSQAGGFVQSSLLPPQVSMGSSGMHVEGIPSMYKPSESSMNVLASSLSGQANQRPISVSSEASSSSSGANYDFSSLVAGVLSKQ